jgi:glycosyltransferase involved in cell wall biosynthesis
MKKVQPLISVIFCVNRPNIHLKKAIISVLNQSFQDFEFLIGANGCSDEFFNELKDLCSDPRILLFRSSLPQLSFTLNFLIENASGQLLVRMDADDVCELNRFQRLWETWCETGADVIGSWATLIDENDNIIGQRCPPSDFSGIKKQFPFSSPIIHPSVMMTRGFWLDSRGYLGGFVSEDFDLWLRAINRGARIINIQEYLFNYRIHSQQASGSRLGYSETAAYWYREFLIRPTIFNLKGLIISSAKVNKLMRRIMKAFSA